MTRPGVVAIVVWVASVGFSFAQDASLDGFGWLAGCWRHEANGRVTREHWMAPSGGTMFGVSRTVAGGSTVAHEFLRIEARGETVVFVANPSGQAVAEFLRIAGTDTEVVFENPDHDFPQRIRYRRLDEDSLIAEISGSRDGRSRAIEFPMERVPCDNPRP